MRGDMGEDCIPLSSPDITDLERRYVQEVLKTPRLSLGPKLSEFEEGVARYIGTKYAVAVNSGTGGLHLCVKSLGIGEGDEVITTPFSFIASANSILYEGALPAFVDIRLDTLNIDPERIEDFIRERCKFDPIRGGLIDRVTDREVRAILPVHVFGQPCDMDELMEIANRYNLAVIEDACEAIGAEYKGQRVGTFGKCGVFAFYPNKQITTGEGGVIVTDDEKIAGLCRSYRNQGRGDGDAWLVHERLGYNYRISDINCALGIAQLERIEQILQRRAEVARMYNERLKEIEGISIPYVSSKVKMSWFVYVVRLGDRFGKEDRDRILRYLRERGIGCSNYFPPIHLQPFYRRTFGYKKGDFPVAEYVSERTIALPFYNNLMEEQVERVVEELRGALRSLDRR